MQQSQPESKPETKTLKPDEFVVIEPSNGKVIVSGQECLAQFRFDPEKCTITVLKSGQLYIDQHGRVPPGGLCLGKGHWCHVTDLEPI